MMRVSVCVWGVRVAGHVDKERLPREEAHVFSLGRAGQHRQECAHVCA